MIVNDKLLLLSLFYRVVEKVRSVPENRYLQLLSNNEILVT